MAQAYSGGLLNTQSLQFRIGSAQFGGPWSQHAMHLKHIGAYAASLANPVRGLILTLCFAAAVARPGDIDELMLFQAVLSADEVTRRFRGDYVSASASTLFMHLRFNEQTGTYARDSSFMLSDANTGTSQTWKAPNAAAVCLPSATLNGAGCAVGTRNDGYLSVWGDGQITTNSANIPWATSDITVEMWVKRRGQGSSSTNDCFFSVGSTSTTGAHLWFGGATTTGRPVLGFYTPDDLIEPTITYTNGAWQHMVRTQTKRSAPEHTARMPVTKTARLSSRVSFFGSAVDRSSSGVGQQAKRSTQHSARAHSGSNGPETKQDETGSHIQPA